MALALRSPAALLLGDLLPWKSDRFPKRGAQRERPMGRGAREPCFQTQMPTPLELPRQLPALSRAPFSTQHFLHKHFSPLAAPPGNEILLLWRKETEPR